MSSGRASKMRKVPFGTVQLGPNHIQFDKIKLSLTVCPSSIKSSLSRLALGRPAQKHRNIKMGGMDRQDLFTSVRYEMSIEVALMASYSMCPLCVLVFKRKMWAHRKHRMRLTQIGSAQSKKRCKNIGILKFLKLLHNDGCA